MMHVLGMLVVLGSGAAAGVLLAVAVSMVPALDAMTPDRYVYTHTLLGRNWDPMMPLIVVGSTMLDIALAVLTSSAAARSLLIVAAVCLVAVSTVSHLCNVPINKRVHSIDPAAIPAMWQDPRSEWRRWHLLRTGIALVALAANGLAVTLLF